MVHSTAGAQAAAVGRRPDLPRDPNSDLPRLGRIVADGHFDPAHLPANQRPNLADPRDPRLRRAFIGDGRNDIDMLAWASAEGLGIAMGQAPPEVLVVANDTTSTDLDDGAAAALALHFQD